MSHYNDKIASMMYDLFNSHVNNEKATGLHEPVRPKQTDGGKPTLKSLLGSNKAPMMAKVHDKKQLKAGSYATYKKQAPVVKGGAKNMEIIESIPEVRTQLERVIGGGEDRPAYVAGGRKKKPIEGATHINDESPQEPPMKAPKKAPKKAHKKAPKAEPPKSNEPATKRRAKLVSKIMKERGVSLPVASKIVKDEKIPY
jgi:hypothetical protein